MNLLDFAAKISALEQRITESGIDPYFERFWPLIRVKLLELSGSQNSISYWLRIRRSFSLAASLLTPVALEQKLDVFVMSAESDFGPRRGLYRDNDTQKAMSRLLDSGLELGFANTATLGVTQVFRGLGGASLLRAMLFAKVSATVSEVLKKEKIPDEQDLVSLIQDIFGLQLSIAPDILFIEELAKEFERILVRLNPKVVIVSVWYSREAMAMTLACKRLNIKTVDYQHGAQNDIHPMYTNWNLRAEGFELMPEIFWTWGEISMNRINKWAKQYKNHRAIVGGNLQAHLCQKEIKSSSSLVGTGQNKKPLIYVTLQGDDIFNDEILKVLEETHNQMDWVFRDHPRLPISSSLERKIMSASGSKARIVRNTSLYEDLQKSSVHVTGFSTCAFEAEVFGVPTIFIHEIAFFGQPEVLETKGFFFYFSKEEIIVGLERLLKRTETPNSNYIEKNVDSNSVLASLMN